MCFLFSRSTVLRGDAFVVSSLLILRVMLSCSASSPLFYFFLYIFSTFIQQHREQILTHFALADILQEPGKRAERAAAAAAARARARRRLVYECD